MDMFAAMEAARPNFKYNIGDCLLTLGYADQAVVMDRKINIFGTKRYLVLIRSGPHTVAWRNEKHLFPLPYGFKWNGPKL